MLQWAELGVTLFWLVGRHPVPAVGARLTCRPGQRRAPSADLRGYLRSSLWSCYLLVDLLRSDLQLFAFSSGSCLPQQALPHLPAQGLMPLCRTEAGAFVGLTHSHIFLVSQVSLPFFSKVQCLENPFIYFPSLFVAVVPCGRVTLITVTPS